MLFTSISFLYYFLPTIIILYFITPKKYRNYILLIFSIIFYMYGEPKYVILMLVEILVAYFGALLIDKYKSKLSNIQKNKSKNEKQIIKEKRENTKNYQKRK